MNTRHYYLRLLRTFALAALTAAAVAACSDDTDTDREPLTPPDGADGIPVAFTANINSGSDADPAGAPGTRTVLTPTTEGGFTVTWKGKDTYSYSSDQIFIWAAMGNTLANDGNYKIYVPTTSDVSSELVPYNDGPKLTLTDPGEWKFTATYSSTIMNGAPYVALGYQTQSAPDNTDHIAEEDFSVATTTQTVEAGDMPQIGLQFKHQLSALQLQVKNETGAELTVEEIRLSVTGDQIVNQKIYDLAMEDWKADGEYKKDYLKLTITTPAALASNDGTVQKFHMLLFPEPAHGGTDMIITVITDRGEYTLTKTAPASPGFEAGKNYLTDITIKSSGLQANETWTETISTPEQLAAFRERVNGGDNYQGKTVRLAANITLTGTWTPIGTDGNKPFSGTFGGGGYSISGLNVDTGSEGYAGLFGYITGGTVRNLRVSGTVTTTGDWAGGIAGYLEGSTVENCIFDGEVSGNFNVGGIAGHSKTNSRIAGCYTKGNVTATLDIAGGIAGYNEANCTLTDCYSEAEVKVTMTRKVVGGIAGKNSYGGTITYCYATGKVSGRNFVGGIVGSQYNSAITGCIALNPGLTRTEDYQTTFGRIAGNNDRGTFASCAAYDGMTLPDGITVTSAADGIHGDALPAADCLTPAAYTSRCFPEATATTPGWAFDAAAPWQYLPWNKAFESFHNISETDYRISVPDHLKAPVIN